MKAAAADEARAARASDKRAPTNPAPQRHNTAPARRKLSYKEARELEALEAELPRLESEKSELESRLSSGALSHEELTEASGRIGELIRIIEEKEMRWLELSEV